MTKQMVIFFDIDGTLLPEGHTEVPEDALSAIRAAQENGHLCLINTGRALGHIEPYLRGLANFLKKDYLKFHNLQKNYSNHNVIYLSYQSSFMKFLYFN